MFATLKKFHVLPAIIAKSSLNQTMCNRRIGRNHGFLFKSRSYSSEKCTVKCGEKSENPTKASTTSKNCGDKTQIINSKKPSCHEKNFCNKIVETENINAVCISTKKYTEKVSVNCKFEASEAVESASKISKSCQQLSETPSQKKCSEKKSQSTCSLDVVKSVAMMRKFEENSQLSDKVKVASFSTCTTCGIKTAKSKTTLLTTRATANKSGGSKENNNSCSKSEQPNSTADSKKTEGTELSVKGNCDLPKRADRKLYEKTKAKCSQKALKSTTNCNSDEKEASKKCAKTKTTAAVNTDKCEKPRQTAASKPEQSKSAAPAAAPCKSQAASTADKNDSPKSAAPCNSLVPSTPTEAEQTKLPEPCTSLVLATPAGTEPPKAAEPRNSKAAPTLPKEAGSCRAQKKSEKSSKEIFKPSKCGESKQAKVAALPAKASICQKRKEKSQETSKPTPSKTCDKSSEKAKPAEIVPAVIALGQCEAPKQKGLSKCESPKNKETSESTALGQCGAPKQKGPTKCEISKNKETAATTALGQCEAPKQKGSTKCESSKNKETAVSTATTEPKKCETTKSQQDNKPADAGKCDKPKQAEMVAHSKCEAAKQKPPTKCGTTKEIAKSTAKSEDVIEIAPKKPASCTSKSTESKPAEVITLGTCEAPKKNTTQKCSTPQPQEAKETKATDTTKCEKSNETAKPKRSPKKGRCRTLKAVPSYAILKTKGKSKSAKPNQSTSEKPKENCDKTSTPTPPATQVPKCEKFNLANLKEQPTSGESTGPVKCETAAATSKVEGANEKCAFSKGTASKPGRSKKNKLKASKSASSLKDAQPRYTRVKKCKSDSALKAKSQQTKPVEAAKAEAAKAEAAKAEAAESTAQNECATANPDEVTKPQAGKEEVEEKCMEAAEKSEPVKLSGDAAQLAAAAAEPTKQDYESCDPCVKLLKQKQFPRQNFKKDGMELAAFVASKSNNGGFGGGCRSTEWKTTESFHNLSSTYRTLSMLTILAVAVLCGYTYLHIEHHERPEFKAYDYMRRRTKRFPWGDGTKSYFHNPEKNALPDGYETDEED